MVNKIKVIKLVIRQQTHGQIVCVFSAISLAMLYVALSLFFAVNNSEHVIISKGLVFCAGPNNLTPCNFLKRHKPQLPE